jgi:hypothetical protein
MIVVLLIMITESIDPSTLSNMLVNENSTTASINTIQLYSNPTSGIFSVSIESPIKKAIIEEILILDKMGNSVHKLKFSNNLSTQTISLSTKPADIYIVKVFD